MTLLKVRFSEKKKQLITNKVEHYKQTLDYQVIKHFLPGKYSYTIVDEEEPADICIVGINHDNPNLLRSNEVNVLISTKNLESSHCESDYLNNFDLDKHPKINIFIHNHISDCIYFRNKYGNNIVKCIPTINLRCKMFKSLMYNYEKIMNCSFQDKKFCLFISNNRVNKNKTLCVQQMLKIGNVDFINQYQFKYLIKEPSTYGIELMKLFNQYKFIICFETSKKSGYISEKIFNVFCAKSIPIYDGAYNISRFINCSSYINFDSKTSQLVKMLNVNEAMYNKYIDNHKLFRYNPDYILEDFLDPYLPDDKVPNILEGWFL